MPIDPQEGIDDWFVPADPSQWQTGALPRIIVHPNPPSALPDNPAGADGIDDWFVPGTAPASADGPDDWYVPTNVRADTSYPDDWYVPAPPATPSPGPSAPGAQPDAANPGFRNPATARPDPFAAYWAMIPASRAGAMAWHPPIFPNSAGQFPFPAPALVSAPRIDPTRSLLGALANLPATNAPSYGLLGAIANLPSANPAAFPSFQRTGPAPGGGDQFAPPSLFSSLANLAWSPPPAVSDTSSDAGSYAPESDRPLQFAPPDWAPFGAQPSDVLPGFTSPAPNSQLASPFASPFLQTTNPTSDNSNRPARQSLPNMPGLGYTAPSVQSAKVEDNSGGSPSAAPEANEARSITRVVRDSAGRPLAIIHAQPAPSSESDATPDALRPGAKYAQINRALTGDPFIDRTTKMLLAVLQQSVIAIGSGWGPLFGIRVHNDFGKRVQQLDLPGIGQDGVEQSYHFGQDFARYGLDGSIRTDVTLRNPRDPSQRPVAVYDVKTGNAVLRPSRVEEILKALKDPDLPVIILYYGSGDAVMAPRQ